jgi:hypothetical protein
MEAQMFRMNPKRENGDPPFLGSSGLSVLVKKIYLPEREIS